MIQGDVPIACTESGAVYTLAMVAEGNPAFMANAIATVERDGVNARFVAIPCADCRSTPSSARSLTRRSTCEYRPLQGPLYVPRALGASSSQDRGSSPLP